MGAFSEYFDENEHLDRMNFIENYINDRAWTGAVFDHKDCFPLFDLYTR
jgi:hypothetical protein